MANSTQIRNSTASAPPPVPLACTECRNRHMKCDAKSPICSRCQSEERQCQYIQSRRGYKGPRKRRAVSELDIVSEDRTVWQNTTREINTIFLDQSSSTAIGQPACKDSIMTMAKPQAPQLLPLEMMIPFSDAVYDQNIFLSPPDDFIRPLTDPVPNDQLSGGCRTRNPSGDRSFTTSDSVDDIEAVAYRHSLNLYYLHFHESHPILLPRKFLFKYLFEQYPGYLKKMMQIIGSNYDPKTPNCTHQIAIDTEILGENSNSGYLVQSLLLSAIFLYARDEQERATQKLDSAIKIAVDIGMNSELFAAENGCGSRDLEECWRKTWWELYVVDGLLKLHNRLPFRSWNIEMDVLLPVDERPDSNAIVRPDVQ